MRGSELPVDQRSSYLRSRQIALKKFSPQGGTLAEAPKRALGAFLPDPAPAGWRHWRHNHFIRRQIDLEFVFGIDADENEICLPI
jgi:hypothetical protein